MATGLTHSTLLGPLSSPPSRKPLCAPACIPTIIALPMVTCDYSVLAPCPLDCAAKARIVSSGAPAAGPDIL